MKPFFYVIIVLAAFAALASCNKDKGGESTETDGSINGLYWAEYNVDAPGTFSSAAEPYGMFYQWNRKTGWIIIPPLKSSPAGSEWDASYPTGDTWEVANDPCPTGWRVPTADELKTLLDGSKVKRETDYRNGIWGLMFTDIASGNSIFFPAPGILDGAMGTQYQLGSSGCYWSGSASDTQAAYCLYLLLNKSFTVEPHSSHDGNSVRCVRE